MEPAVQEARTACDDRRWGDARRRFEQLVDDDLDVDALAIDDLDAYATAAYLTGSDEEGFALWTRAHQRCADDESVHRAAHFGVRLAECLCFKGDVPRARGWVDRTARLLEEAAIDCVESGYLERSASPRDRRLARISLSLKGQMLCEKLRLLDETSQFGPRADGGNDNDLLTTHETLRRLEQWWNDSLRYGGILIASCMSYSFIAQDLVNSLL